LTPVDTPAARRSALVGRLVLAAALGMLFLVLPHGLFGDDLQRFDDLEALLHRGELSDSRYSLVMPLLSSPLVLIGHVVGSPEGFAARFNVVVVAVGLLVAARLLRGRIDRALFFRFALVLLFASLLTNRLRDYNAEVLTATLVSVGAVAIAAGRRVVAGWAAIVVGVVNTPAALAGLALVAGGEAVRTRRLRFLLPIVVAAALVASEAWIRRGSPFTTGYEDDHGVRTILPYSGRPGFSYPFVLGIAALLFSFGRGLLFFAPGLAFWLSTRTRSLAAGHRRVVVLLLLFLVGLVLVYARWWAWYGGLAWGPRFFVVAAVPASFLLALRLGDVGRSAAADAITLGVLALSAWVGAAGALADPTDLSFCARDDYALESLCWYAPEYSSLWRPVLDPPAFTASNALVAASCLAVFAYLATPLVLSLVRAVSGVDVRARWLTGWRP